MNSRLSLTIESNITNKSTSVHINVDDSTSCFYYKYKTAQECEAITAGIRDLALNHGITGLLTVMESHDTLGKCERLY